MSEIVEIATLEELTHTGDGQGIVIYLENTHELVVGNLHNPEGTLGLFGQYLDLNQAYVLGEYDLRPNIDSLPHAIAQAIEQGAYHKTYTRTTGEYNPEKEDVTMWAASW